MGRKKQKVIGFCEQLAEQSIYLAEPEVCFWCLLPVKTLEHWVCGQLPSGGLTIHYKTSLLEDHPQFVSSYIDLKAMKFGHLRKGSHNPILKRQQRSPWC